MGRNLRIEEASEINSESVDANLNTKSIFVGNLSFNVDEKELLAAFSHLGKIEDCRIAKDKTTGNVNLFKSIYFVV